jgi:hypothetical protein
MSGDTVTLKWDEKHEFFFWLWGHETFYSQDRSLINFLTEQEAHEWIRLNHPELTKV